MGLSKGHSHVQAAPLLSQGNVKGKRSTEHTLGNTARGCQGKAGRGREHPGKETVTLLEKQVCALQTGDNRDGICPFSRDVEQAQPPIKLFTSDRAPLPQCLCWSRDFPTGLPGPHPRSLPWLSLPSFLALQQPTAMSPELSLTLTG